MCICLRVFGVQKARPGSVWIWRSGSGVVGASAETQDVMDRVNGAYEA